MKHYLFFINHLYAYSILRPLQKTIRMRGDDVAWFLQGADAQYLRPDEKQLHTVDEVIKYNPVAVYVPGNWVPGFFPGVKVEVFHGLANDETGKKGHYRIRGLFDLYCTHAPEVTRQFEQLAEKYKTFCVAETGWPKLDPLFNPDLCDLSPYDDFKSTVAPDKPVVFYASTFSPSLTSAPYLIETIRALSKSSRWYWLVTLHPKMPDDIVAQYKAMEGDNFTFVDSHYDVLPLLKAADVMLCDTSSIALEYLLLNKPLVTFKAKVPGNYAINIRDESGVEAAIFQALTNPGPLLRAAAAFIARLHDYSDGKSSERVLQATDDFIEHDLSRMKSKPLNLWRKFQVRKRMSYYKLMH
ncbi:Putative glycerophosphate (or ribitol phosphate) transferase relatede to lipopolysaccharide core biosynthesis [hydrothermal vent metagenome]|uniref:Glycerophosphate (Or ribitol phosphate) transferase relatede to lipopolysaccharide core biosynthesis n=1 Tax=hydrothermal vent metagenome TaxID=652676 RepID=A0A3B0Y4A7_9ZZZZ